MKKVGIIGAGSLTAGALLKLLLEHKHVEIALCVSESGQGKSVTSVHTELYGLIDMEFCGYEKQEIVDKCDVVFFCHAHGDNISKTVEIYDIAKNKKKKIKFIDLSADFRLKDVSLYRQWYGFEHRHEEITKKAVYGLPEIYYDKIRKADFIANPGCYPTSTVLGLAPLLKNKLVKDSSIIIDAYSGVSGAGRRLNERNLAVSVEENILPYKVGTHQHTPEMEQELSALAGSPIKACFVPHVVAFKYGMMTTAYVKLKKNNDWEAIYTLYKKFYVNKPFVRVKGKGEYPEVKNVVGTNFFDVGIVLEKRTGTYVLISCIDNMIKGASGQAIQNMNIMLGLNQTEGLPFSRAIK